MPCFDPVLLRGFADDVVNIRSRRMRILLVLKKILETITKANGYTIDVDEVSFDVKSWRDRTSGNTPVIYIVDNNQVAKRFAGKTRQYTWNLLLFGVVKEEDIEVFEEFLADIEECVELNGWLGGIATKSEVNDIKTDNQLFSETERTHLFEMQIQVEFCRAHGDPR